MIRILPLFLLVLLVSCSSIKQKNSEGLQTPDLVEIFDLQEKKFDKFKTVNSKEIVKSKKIKKKLSKTKPLMIQRKGVAKKSVQASLASGRKLSEYPQDFPEQYIEYDQRSEKIWKHYKPNYFIGEVLEYSVRYLGVSAGKVKIITSDYQYLGDRKTIHFQAMMRSSSFYKFMYRINDTLDIYMDFKSFIPVKYSLIQNETNKTVNDLQLFDHDKMMTYFRYKRVKKKQVKNRKSDVFVPKYFQNYLSTFFFFRGLPLSIGKQYNFPIVSKAKVGIIDVVVDGIEELKLKRGKFKAWRLQAKVVFPQSTKKKDHLTLWLSNDSKKILLKFSAKIKLGSIKGELINER